MTRLLFTEICVTQGDALDCFGVEVEDIFSPRYVEVLDAARIHILLFSLDCGNETS